MEITKGKERIRIVFDVSKELKKELDDYVQANGPDIHGFQAYVLRSAVKSYILNQRRERGERPY